MEQTTFDVIYNSFTSKITDDMYIELTEAETNSMQKELLMNALHWFEFPRVDIYDFNEGLEEYNILLSNEEINIISTYMVVEWFGYQIANVVYLPSYSYLINL